MVEMVSEELRRAHSRAIAHRDRWRRQYNFLSQAIRRTKLMVANANFNNTFDGVAEAELRALRLSANYMMLERADIKWDLRTTAYTYASKEELVAA